MNIKIDESCVVYEDNAVTTKIVNNVWAIKRTKHIDVCHHFLREPVELINRRCPPRTGSPTL